jgi:2-methylcitrate dehydratase
MAINTPPPSDDNAGRPYDDIITKIIDYVYGTEVPSAAAWARAKAALLDALGAAVESVHASSECQRLIAPTLGSPVALPNGFRLPGTSQQLDMYKGAFNLGAMIRYLDHNDAFPGAEWGHPSGEFEFISFLFC